MDSPERIPKDLAREIHLLVRASLEGTAGDEELARLDQIICTNPGTAAYLARTIQTSQHLCDWAVSYRAGGANVPPALDSSESVPPALSGRDGGAASPVLGFLGNLAHLGGSFTPTLWTLLVLVSGMVFTLALVVVLAIRGIHVYVEQPGGEQGVAQSPLPPGDDHFVAPEGVRTSNSPLPPGENGHHVPTVGVGGTAVTANPKPPISNLKSQIPNLQSARRPAERVSRPPVAHSSAAVARLIRVAGCCWAENDSILQPGDAIVPGKSLRLASGIVELRFDIGIRTVLQGPARLDLLSASKVLTSEILRPEARGFEVETCMGTVVDIGTEFGVQVTPSHDVQVHVFKGEVLFRSAAVTAVPAVAQHLIVGEGLRLEAEEEPLLVIETGDEFIRTMEQVDRDRHVVAYWRFEDRPVGSLLPHTQRNNTPVRATMDSSCNGNDLFTFGDESQPRLSGDVPAATIPQSGEANRGCIDNSASSARYVRSLTTHTAFSHASPINIQKIVPLQWTIEASVKPMKLDAGVQTFVGRDGCLPFAKTSHKHQPRLAFQIDGQGRFAIWFIDCSGRKHAAVAKRLRVEENHWYHLAATSDGHRLRLYADTLNGRGYQVQADNALSDHGHNALSRGESMAEWTVGRGRNVELPAQQFLGLIDEVRISDVARSPAEFLFAPKDQGKEKGLVTR